MQAIDIEREKKILLKKNKELTTEETTRIIEMNQKLKKRQATQDDINILPTLTLSDVKSGVDIIKSKSLKTKQDIYLFKQNTNNLFYASISFELNKLDKKLLLLVPFF